MTPPTARPAPDRSPAVLVVGDIVTDVLVLLCGDLAPGSDTPAAIRSTGGGSAANTAVWLARLGRPVTLVSVVGTDAAGDTRLAELAAEGVGTAVRREPAAGTGTVIVLAAPHERTMINDRGANLHLSTVDIESAFAAGPAGHLHLSGYPLLDPASRPAARHALAGAAARGMTTSVGAGSAAPLRRAGPADFLSWVRGADLLIANADEAAALLGDPPAGDTTPAGNPPAGDTTAPAGGTGPAPDPPPGDTTAPARLAARLADVRGGAVVVTAGPRGAAWAHPGGAVTTVAAVAVTAVDPTGAGDAFSAGLLARWLAGAGRRECLAAGAGLAAGVVTRPGARPAIDLPAP